MFGEPIDMIGIRVDRAWRQITHEHVFSHSIGGWCLTIAIRSHGSEPGSSREAEDTKQATDKSVADYFELDCSLEKRKAPQSL